MPSRHIDPDRTALLLMDFQPGILGSIGDPGELLANAMLARDIADSAGVRVVYIRVAFDPQDYEAIPRRNKAFSQVAAAKMLAADSPEAGIHADLVPREGDVVITKTRFGS